MGKGTEGKKRFAKTPDLCLEAAPMIFRAGETSLLLYVINE